MDVSDGFWFEVGRVLGRGALAIGLILLVVGCMFVALVVQGALERRRLRRSLKQTTTSTSPENVTVQCPRCKVDCVTSADRSSAGRCHTCGSALNLRVVSGAAK